MNKWHFAATGLVLTGCLGGAALAQGETADLSPADTIRLLEEVEKIRERLVEERYGVHASSIQAFKAAGASTTAAYDFYLKCYKLVHFERRDARESEYREWRQRNVEYLRSKEHSEARRLQLQYLVLTLQAAQLKDDAERRGMVPRLVSLMDAALAVYADLGQSRKILHEDALGSVYAQAYDLKATLGHMKGWGDGPLDIAGNYGEFILPLHRSAGRAKDLAAHWDRRISLQTQMVAALDDEMAERRFSETTLPALRWSKQLDMLRAGRRKEALTAMVELVKAYGSYEGVDAWLDELAGYLSGQREFPRFEE